MEGRQPMGTSAVQIPRIWANWIEENRALGVPPHQIDAILSANGFDMSTFENPAIIQPESADTSGTDRTLARMQALLAVYARLWREVRGAASVDQVSGITGETFFRWYYAANRPVVLLDGMTRCAALRSWTPDSLKARFGNEPVEVMTERVQDEQYELNSERHKTTMQFNQFVDLVQSSGESNDFYMVANNRTLEHSRLGYLMDEIQVFDEILDNTNRASKVFIWFGPSGTVTPLHHDSMNVLLTQITGSKLITLIPSFELPLVYNHVGVYSEVDCEQPDYSRYPLFQHTSRVQVVLEPGQALFIPVGWWHHVRSLDISISVSFTNFHAPNDYTTEFGGY
jgi:ribosomal protein L16 Arg81 hydroxylase